MKKYSICDLNVLMDAGEITDRRAEKYKDANSSFSGIEVSVVRADSTNVITKKFS